jgi:hypothetical protein
MFRELTGIHEPSAIQQLEDGRFLIVEDEKQYPFSLVTLGADGSAGSKPLSMDALAEGDGFAKLDDLEGIALDRAGFIYAITSHSRDDDGDEKKSRDKLVRFRIEGDRAVAPKVVKGIKPALTSAHPVLAAAAALRDVKADAGLNIEALEMSPDQQRLLIGFRSPLLDARAIIASIDNPSAIFESDEPPRVAPTLTTLDLGGDGIRGMSHIPALDGWLLISGPVSRQQVQFRLWFWSGQADRPARPVTVPGLPGFEHAEGVSPALIDGRQQVIFVSDDGNRKQGLDAHYLLLDPAQLRVAP